MEKEKKELGFTLLELMVSISIFTLVMMAAVKMLVDQRKEYMIADQYLALQGKVRAALDLLAGEIRMAGSGINQNYATPILYGYNDKTTLGNYPKLSDLRDQTAGQNRSFAILAFQYNRADITRNDSSKITDLITNDEVLILAPSDSSSNNTLKSFNVGTYTDEGTSQCSLLTSTGSCVPGYVSTGTINLKGDSNSETFTLYIYSINSNGSGYTSNELIDNVISFDVTFYLDASNNGYSDVVTRATGNIKEQGIPDNTDNLGDNFDNDGDGTVDEKAELETIEATTSTTCGKNNTTAIFCDSSNGLLAVPFSTKNSSALTLTGNDTITASKDIIEITSATDVELKNSTTIAAPSNGEPYVTLTNVGDKQIVFYDQSIGTNLALKKTSISLGPRQSLTFKYLSSSSLWVQQSSAVEHVAMVKITLTVRSDRKSPKDDKYLVYSGSITTKIRGYAL